jgi:hypothetical protein
MNARQIVACLFSQRNHYWVVSSEGSVDSATLPLCHSARSYFNRLIAIFRNITGSLCPAKPK